MTDEELSRLRRRTELALARARVADETPHRDRLLSVDDIEEITGRTATLIDEKLRDNGASVEIETPKGYRVKGAAWPVVVIVLVVAAAAIAWRLAQGH